MPRAKGRQETANREIKLERSLEEVAPNGGWLEEYKDVPGITIMFFSARSHSTGDIFKPECHGLSVILFLLF
jgi:hypothetical protein